MKKIFLSGMVGVVLFSSSITSCTKELSKELSIGENPVTATESTNKQNSVVNPSTNIQEPINGYFVYSYENYAWVHQMDGWIIDKSGNVKGYSNPSKWNRLDSKGYISQKEMDENLSFCNTSIGKIPIEMLSYYSWISTEIKSDKYSEWTSIARDMGLYKFYYYSLDSVSGKYKAILLCQEGDWATYNKDANAIIITNWLKSFSPKGF